WASFRLLCASRSALVCLIASRQTDERLSRCADAGHVERGTRLRSIGIEGIVFLVEEILHIAGKGPMLANLEPETDIDDLVGLLLKLIDSIPPDPTQKPRADACAKRQFVGEGMTPVRRQRGLVGRRVGSTEAFQLVIDAVDVDDGLTEDGASHA